MLVLTLTSLLLPDLLLSRVSVSLTLLVSLKVATGGATSPSQWAVSSGAKASFPRPFLRVSYSLSILAIYRKVRVIYCLVQLCCHHQDLTMNVIGCNWHRCRY